MDYFDCFVNKFTKATEGEKLKSLKAYREDSNVQNMAKAVFDFSLTDAEMAAISALKKPDGRIVSPPFAPKWDV